MEEKYFRESLHPSSQYVFLTWHDINFTVPNNLKPKGVQPVTMVDIDDDQRVNLLKQH